MIAPPTRLAPAPRGPAAAVRGPNADEAESPQIEAAVDAHIAALVARASTPEDEALERQREEFDYVARVQAETERETNALRDMAMEQMKNDDELLKKWIELI